MSAEEGTEEAAALQQAQEPDTEIRSDVPVEITHNLEAEQTVVQTKTGDEHPVDEFYYIMNSILFAYNMDSLDENAIKEVDRIYTMMQNYQGIEI